MWRCEHCWRQVKGELPFTKDLWSCIVHEGGSNLWIEVNANLQSCLADVNIIFNPPFPKNFRCIISGPSECGKTVLLKNLIIHNMKFDKLYIVGLTGKQYDDLKYLDIVYMKDIKDLPGPDKLPEDI